MSWLVDEMTVDKIPVDKMTCYHFFGVLGRQEGRPPALDLAKTSRMTNSLTEV